MRRQMHRGMVAALLSAFVWPGAGQLWALSHNPVGAESDGVARPPAPMRRMCTTKLRLDLDADLVRTLPAQVLAARSGTLLVSSLVLLLAWAYGIVDAYVGGRGRRKLTLEPRPPPSPPAGP